MSTATEAGFAILLLALWLSGAGHASQRQNKESFVNEPRMTPWQVIDALSQQVPFSRMKIETVLGTRLNEVRRTTYTVFLEGGGVGLSSDVRITKIDLRLGVAGDGTGFLVLSIDGRCINLEEVRQHYAELKITDMPRGRSLDESTSHTAKLPWGELSFGFKERNPECVATIAFEPKNA